MKLVTSDDIIDVLAKGKQRGISFLLSKLTLRRISRTKSAFDQSIIRHANWWIIPAIRERWNTLITGNPSTTYEEFMMEEYLKNYTHLRLLSIGSGSCSHELALAQYSNFEKIVCVDLAQNRLNEARAIAQKNKLGNIEFKCIDIYKHSFDQPFDIVFFHSSLHHFANISTFIGNHIPSLLKPKGLLIINEYVGPTRLQHPSHQIKAINQALSKIPNKYRRRFQTNWLKKSYSGSGLFRMILADPSECIDSEQILPTIHKHFTPIIKRPYGGNLLMHVLKDISHHFVNLNPEKTEILRQLFEEEDQYLKSNSSDFIFGIYQKN